MEHHRPVAVPKMVQDFVVYFYRHIRYGGIYILLVYQCERRRERMREGEKRERLRGTIELKRKRDYFA